ncbi:MAG: YceD family protein [Egibacteraceae bacterium]
MTTDTVLSVAGLIDRPGASRWVDLALPVPGDLDLLLATVAEPIRLTGEVAGVVAGVLVRGVLGADLRLQCARCLEDIAVAVATDVVELFSDPLRVDRLRAGARGVRPRKLVVAPEAVIEEGYQIADGTINLDTLVRDALVSAVPCQPLCDIACKGLCPVCGINRNEVECACQETATDPRWMALESLRLKADGA